MADEDTTVAAPEVEQQAREMGWRPKEEFKGAEDKWVDAATFVERGEHVLPIVKATNERLRTDLTKTTAELREIREALAESQKTIQALDRYHQEDVKQKVEKARKDLKEQIIAAKKAGDVDVEVDLTEELSKLNTADAAALANNDDEKTVKTVTKAVDHTQDPVFIAWKNDNPWFGTDRAKTAIAYDITAELRRTGNTDVGRKFLDTVATEVAKEVARLGGGRPAAPKAEGGKGGAGGNHGGNGSAKGYADLPAEAKEACRGFERDLVGKNKKYATVAEWHKSYAEQYFREV